MYKLLHHTVYITSCSYKEEYIKEIKKVSHVETVERLYAASIASREKIAAKQFLKHKEEIAQMKMKPYINESSKMLLRDKDIAPIHQRVDEVLEQKEFAIQRMKEEAIRINEEKLMGPCTFHPDTLNKSRSRSEIRSVSDYAKEHYTWQMKKNEALEKHRFDLLVKEMDGVTFKPEINKNSRQIVKKVLDLIHMHVLKIFIRSMRIMV